ncbi:MAG: hypothetical protein R2695_09895 [Acidimicrobiales bacterium]
MINMEESAGPGPVSAPPRPRPGWGQAGDDLRLREPGLLRSERHLDGKSSTFDPGEIDRFRRRKADHRPGRLEVPVAPGITEVVDGTVRYRDHDLRDLVAAGHHYEAVAHLLWLGSLDDGAAWEGERRTATAVRRVVRSMPGPATPTDRMDGGRRRRGCG